MTIAILTFLAPIALIAASVLAFRGPEFRPPDPAHRRDGRARRVGRRAFSGSC
jgi:hypothetical protein